jgi:hypothetical protein
MYEQEYLGDDDFVMSLEEGDCDLWRPRTSIEESELSPAVAETPRRFLTPQESESEESETDEQKMKLDSDGEMQSLHERLAELMYEPEEMIIHEQVEGEEDPHMEEL